MLLWAGKSVHDHPYSILKSKLEEGLYLQSTVVGFERKLHFVLESYMKGFLAMPLRQGYLSNKVENHIGKLTKCGTTHLPS